jgi:hypothetical protein
LLLVLGWLLVAHGCHGDEDNELFAVIGRLLNCSASTIQGTIDHE